MADENKKQYLLLTSEIIAKMVIILGPDIAFLKAQEVPGLSLDGEGNASDITQDKVETLKRLVDDYVDLAGQAVKDVVDSIFAKYPQIKKPE
jgi:hypothetical protein